MNCTYDSVKNRPVTAESQRIPAIDASQAAEFPPLASRAGSPRNTDGNNASRMMFLAGTFSPLSVAPGGEIASGTNGWRVRTPDRRGLTSTHVDSASCTPAALSKRLMIPTRTALPSGGPKAAGKACQLPLTTEETVKTLRLDELPEEIIFTVLEFLLPSQILCTFGVLNSHCHALACHPEVWEHRLQRIHPIIDLLDLRRYSLAERRSKGRVQLAQLKGSKLQFVVRSVSLEMTNAGKDDGVPTSCLRELSLASSISHPNIIQCYGGLVEGCHLRVVSEYCGPSLLLLTQSVQFNAKAVKSFLGQLFCAVAALHRRGIIHRNIKSDNIAVEQRPNLWESTVKLTDLAMGRAIDFPLGMYTPEDPKERDRSFREQRRLYNRAPELILRQAVYGLEVDIWSVGCVFIEMALGVPPFRCETEIGLLMSTLQLCGTPDISLWDRLSCPPETFLRLPRWEPVDFRAVAVVLSVPGLQAQGMEAFPLAKYKSQPEAVKTLLKFGAKVGIAGLHLLERLLIVPGCFRVTADEALSFPYFTDADADRHPIVVEWLKSWLSEYEERPRLGAEMRSEGDDLANVIFYDRFIKAACAGRGAGNDENPYWNALKAMEERSVRLPARYDLISAMHFNYEEELQKLKPQGVDINGSPPIALSALEATHEPQSGFLTPAPGRSRRLHRRRRESATPTEIDPAELMRPRGGSSAGILDVMEADQGSVPSQILTLDGAAQSSPQSRFEEMQYGMVGSGSDIGTPIDFELDFSRICTPQSHRRFWGGNLPVERSLLVEHPTRRLEDVERSESGSEFSTSGHESWEGQHFATGARNCLPESHRRQIALSQSPLNKPKLRGEYSPKPPKSWRQVFSLWGKDWEKLEGTKPLAKKSFATSWFTRNGLQQNDYVSTFLPTEEKLFLLNSCPACMLPRISPRSRIDIVDYLLGVQPELLLKSQTLHIAVGLFDRYASFLIGYPDEFSACDFIPVALACLKIADLYNELSKEYYKQDNISEYYEFTSAPPPAFGELVDEKGRILGHVKVEPAQLLAEEKQVLNTLRFNVLFPTVCWFVDAYLSIAKLIHATYLVDFCHYLADLSLLSHRLLGFRPALVAQTVLLIGCCSLFRPHRHTHREQSAPSSAGGVIRSEDEQFLEPLEQLLCYFIALRDELCAMNCAYEALDCIAAMRDLMLNGRRYFEALGRRNVERLHPWVVRLSCPTPTIPPRLVRCILPSSQDGVLRSLT